MSPPGPKPPSPPRTRPLAAIGAGRVSVCRRPVVAIISTGDEIVPPGTELLPGQVHDANGRLLADAVRETTGGATPARAEASAAEHPPAPFAPGRFTGLPLVLIFTGLAMQYLVVAAGRAVIIR